MRKTYRISFLIAAILISILLVFRLSGFSMYRYSPEALSMHPTISPADLVIVKNIHPKIKNPDRRMVVLLNQEGYSHPLTKRIIATEGDYLRIKDDTVYINDTSQSEPYARFQMTSEKEYFEGDRIDSIVVSKGYLFVMGDNRDNSIDSRHPDFGLVPVEAIIGIPVLQLWSKSDKKIQRIR
jgi:signal peptidase I